MATVTTGLLLSSLLFSAGFSIRTGEAGDVSVSDWEWSPIKGVDSSGTL